VGTPIFTGDNPVLRRVETRTFDDSDNILVRYVPLESRSTAPVYFGNPRRSAMPSSRQVRVQWTGSVPPVVVRAANHRTKAG